MRVFRILQLLLLIDIIACKNTTEYDSALRLSGFDYAYSLYESKNDSAFYYFNQIATTTNDSINKAVALTFMGIIQSRKGDYFGAEESLLESLTLLEKRPNGSEYYLMSCYYHLGDNSRSLKNYDYALKYLDSSIAHLDSNSQLPVILNSKAVVYQQLGNYRMADSIFSSLIETTEINTAEFARILSNRAWTRWQAQPSYYAPPDILRAIPILDSLKEYLSINACYAYLADYYTIPKPDSALHFAQRRLELLKSLKSPDDEKEALDKLIKVSPAKDQLEYYTQYQKVDDSLQTARNRAKNQFALIRYEAEKSKADNFQLQKDNAQKDLYLLLAVGGATAIIIIGYITYRKRRQKIEAAAQIAIRDNQLKTSQKVHDVVANGLYRIMTEVEHNEQIERDNLLDKIDDLYKKSRDISYEHPTATTYDFEQVITALADSYRNTHTNIYVIGNKQHLWDRLSAHKRNEIEKVLEELLVNMKKHSKATTVTLRFEPQDSQVLIYYADNGIGLPDGYQAGNGLTNTVFRIKGIGGAFIFEPTTKGLKIHITVPSDKSS